VKLFREHPDVLNQLRDRYQYILIDEYQDTNHAQFLIAHALASGSREHQNICATGDPDQSIYGWRGANLRNILDFEEHYPNATVVRLEQNYRSTKHILAVADQLIRQNRQRKHKSLWTENETGEKVRLATLRDERHEAQWVLDQLKQHHDERNIPWGEMAVFYRINSLSRVMEDTLRDAGVPYQIARGTAFYERKEIKDAVAYLRMIANPADEVNLLRIINTPARGISETTVEGLQAHGIAHALTLPQVIYTPAAIATLNTRAATAVQRFGQMLDLWRKAAGLGDSGPGTLDPELSLRGFVERVLRDSGLHEFYSNDKSDPDQERLANLGELVTSAQQFETEYVDDSPDDTGAAPALSRKLDAFLERISLVSDVDSVSPDQGAVTLMTLHAAKGLEFPVVAMIGVEDGLLPHSRANESPGELEEERRLAFVGITRAMRFLSLSHATVRSVFGQTQATIPSRFLKELPAESIEPVDEARNDDFFAPEFAGERKAEALAARSEAQTLANQFAPGVAVRHPHFGLGRVLTISAAGSSTRAQVQFNTAGVKTLILQYANLERV